MPTVSGTGGRIFIVEYAEYGSTGHISTGEYQRYEYIGAFDTRGEKGRRSVYTVVGCQCASLFKNVMHSAACRVQSGGDHVEGGGDDRRELGPCSPAQKPLSFDGDSRRGVGYFNPANPVCRFQPVSLHLGLQSRPSRRQAPQDGGP